MGSRNARSPQDDLPLELSLKGYCKTTQLSKALVFRHEALEEEVTILFKLAAWADERCQLKSIEECGQYELHCRKCWAWTDSELSPSSHQEGGVSNLHGKPILLFMRGEGVCDVVAACLNETVHHGEGLGSMMLWCRLHACVGRHWSAFQKRYMRPRQILSKPFLHLKPGPLHKEPLSPRWAIRLHRNAFLADCPEALLAQNTTYCSR